MIFYLIFTFFLEASTGLCFESVDKAREHLAQSVNIGCELDCVVQLGGQLHKTDLAGLNLGQKQQHIQEIKTAFFDKMNRAGKALFKGNYDLVQKLQKIDLLDVEMAKGMGGWDDALEQAVRTLDSKCASQKEIEQASANLRSANQTLQKWLARSSFSFFVPQNLNEDEQRAYESLCKDLRDLLEYTDYRKEVTILRVSFKLYKLVIGANRLVRTTGWTCEMLAEFQEEKIRPCRELLDTAYHSWEKVEAGTIKLDQELARLSEGMPEGFCLQMLQDGVRQFEGFMENRFVPMILRII